MTVNIETAELLARLRAAVNADHRRAGRRRRRRIATAGAVFAAALVTCTALAVASDLPWWQTGSAPVDPAAVASVATDNAPAKVDISRARTVATAGDAALVAVPLDGSGYCLIPALDGKAEMGSSCDYQVADAQQGGDSELWSSAQPGGRPDGPAWIVYGRITEPSAAAIDLGPFTVSLENGGFFVATVPQSQWSQLDGTANPGTIVDASGATVQAGCVNWGPSPDSRDAGQGSTILWSAGSGPCKSQPTDMRPEVDLDQARQLLTLTLATDSGIWAAGTTLALWQAPAANGWICEFVNTASAALLGTSQGPPSGPGSCHQTPESVPTPARPLLSVGFSGGPGGLVTGQVAPTSGIVKVVLQSAAGSTVLPFGGGWFLGQLPAGGTTGTLPPGGPFTVVGYDANGDEVGSESLEAIQAAARPH